MDSDNLEYITRNFYEDQLSKEEVDQDLNNIKFNKI